MTYAYQGGVPLHRERACLSPNLDVNDGRSDPIHTGLGLGASSSAWRLGLSAIQVVEGTRAPQQALL